MSVACQLQLLNSLTCRVATGKAPEAIIQPPFVPFLADASVYHHPQFRDRLPIATHFVSGHASNIWLAPCEEVWTRLPREVLHPGKDDRGCSEADAQSEQAGVQFPELFSPALIDVVGVRDCGGWDEERDEYDDGNWQDYR